MQLNIGTNIKRLRTEKGFTQEQLADILNISSAAVSKWESQNTYPDITLLFPMAKLFGVSVDELLGYDKEKEREEITSILSEYRKLYLNGQFTQASKLIAEARENYPHDYRIMQKYMWDKAGGSTNNKKEILLLHREELTQICNVILDGCTQDDIRMDAMNLKARLLRANGNTNEALEVLSKLPQWYSDEFKEQLFEKNTAEYRYWNKRNCYDLIDRMARKLARIIRFDNTLSNKEKILRIEAMAKEFSSLTLNKELKFFCIAEYALYAVLAGALSAEDDIEDIIRIREKEFSAMKKMMALAQTDDMLKESILISYKTDDMISWKTELLLNSPHPQYEKLRQYPEYIDMLLKWNSACN